MERGAEIIKELGITWVIVAWAYFIIRYFIAQLSKKDDQLMKALTEYMEVIRNNTEAIKWLKDEISRK